MSMVQINWKPDATELRKFGAAMIVGFGIIGSVLLWREHSAAAMGCYVFGSVTGAIGLTGAKIALPFYWAWMGIAFVMGNIVSRLLLAIVYYGVLTPIGLFRRGLGRDPLLLKRPECDSYWIDTDETKNVESYEKQF
jgi:hypothetical protein